MKQLVWFGGVVFSVLCWVMIFTVVARAEQPPIMNQTWATYIGGWEIASFANPKGEFSHCSLSATWPASNAKNRQLMKADELTINLKLFSDADTGFNVGSNDWKFVVDKVYEVEFKFNDEGRVSFFKLKATAANENILVNEGASNPNFFRDFMAAEDMELVIEGSYIGTFYLKNSRKATEELFRCFRNNTSSDATFGDGDGDGAPTFGGGN